MARKLSIIVPTISGREESLQRTLDAYKKHTRRKHEVVVVENMANWPTACNHGARIANGDLLHFGADDLEPVSGWLTEAAKVCEQGELPAAFVHNHSAAGPVDNAADGQPGDLTHFTRVPLMTREQWDTIGAWPEID
jgi:GT2 family glycosyltransferase